MTSADTTAARDHTSDAIALVRMLNAGHGNDAQVILDRYTGSADQVGLTGTLAMVATLLVSYIDRISPVLAAAKPDYPHASGDDALTLFESLMSQATDSGEPSRAEPISYL